MDSRPRPQMLRCLIFVFVIVQSRVIHAQNFDSLTQSSILSCSIDD